MVLRKALPMDGEYEQEQGEGRLPSATSRTFSVNGQIQSEDSTSFSPDSPSEFNSTDPRRVQMHHTGTSSYDIENPWAQESTADSSNERRELQSHVSDNSFIRGENVANDQAPLNPETHNREPPISTMYPTAHDLGHDQTEEAQAAAYSSKLQSNNPFLKSVQQNTTQQHEGSWGQSESSSQYSEALDGQGNNQGGVSLTSLTHDLSLADNQYTPIVSSYSQASLPTTNDTGSTSWPPSTFDSLNSTKPQNEASYTAPEPAVDNSYFLDGERHNQEYQRPQNNTNVPLINIEPTTPSSSRDLLELDGDFTPKAQNKDQQVATGPDTSSQNQPEGLEGSPPVEQQHPAPDLDAPLPPVPVASPLSEAEIARAREKRSETYDIRHINWTDKTGVLRESPILVQNKNGPCPLLALVNGLVIRANPDTRPPIVRALQTREKISLGLLTEALFDELTSCHRQEDQLPDIEALSSFLLMLHTGMNVNPKLTTEPNTPGKFRETGDINLYSTFKVPLVHGWLASPSTAAHAALSRVAQYHEDIQLLQFRKEELEDQVFRGGSLTQAEQQTVADIDTIQYFVEVENATQLSVFGLDHLERCLEPGSVSILFRNDHFSTLYKHPDSNQLFTLVTDAGYASHAEIVWESLADVNGSNAELFSGDFRPVGHAPAPSRRQQPAAAPSHETNRQDAGAQASAPAKTQNEQADADYAYALSLQFQDEEAQRENARNSRRGTGRRSTGPSHASAPSGSSTHNRSSSSVAHRNQSSVSSRSGRRTSSRPTQEVRPLIPPRIGSADHGTTTATSTNRPEDEGDAPPPTYEQAALSPVYIPPPEHPQYDGSSDVSPERSSSHRQSTGLNHVTSHSSSPGPGPSHMTGNSPMGRRPPGATAAAATERDRERDRHKDCIVM